MWLFYFLTQTNKTIAEGLDLGEKNMISRNAIHLLFVFVFQICLIAFSLTAIFSLLPSIAVAILMATIYMLMDAAILGSKWSLAGFVATEYKWLNTLIGWINSTFKTMIRVGFAVAFAYCVAQLAEMRLQEKRIKTLLRQETVGLNREYISQMETYQRDYDGRITALANEKLALEQQLANESDPTRKQNLELAQSEVAQSVTTMNGINKALKNNQAELLKQQADLKGLRLQFESYGKQSVLLSQKMFDQIHNPNNCRIPGNFKVCAKQKWESFRDAKDKVDRKQIQTRAKIDNTLSVIETLGQKLSDLQQQVEQQKKRLKYANTEIKKFTTPTASKDSTSEKLKRVNELTQQIQQLHNDRETAFNDKKSELANMGFLNEADYDFSDLYSGLQQLHASDKYGESSQQFSLYLKIALILIELTAVLTPLYFSQLSVYSLRMQQRWRNYQQEDDELAQRIHNTKRELELEELEYDLQTKRFFRKQMLGE